MLKKSLLALTLLVSSCGFFRQDPIETETYGTPRYDSNAIQLKVNRIDIVSEFVPSFKRPNVEHLMPVSIEKTARTWVSDHLEAVEPHSTKTATFIIKDASVTEEFIPSGKMFYKDNNRYRATLNVVLKVADSNKMNSAETSINAWRELTIPADTDVAKKEEYWNEMVKKLFDDFNAKMIANTNQYLNMYVKNNDYILNYK